MKIFKKKNNFKNKNVMIQIIIIKVNIKINKKLLL